MSNLMPNSKNIASKVIAIIALITMLITYGSALFLCGVNSYEVPFLHGIRWWLYYACLLYLPLVLAVSLVLYVVLLSEFPYRKSSFCCVNIVVTITLAIIAFKECFMTNSYIALVAFSVEMSILALIDDYGKFRASRKQAEHPIHNK